MTITKISLHCILIILSLSQFTMSKIKEREITVALSGCFVVIILLVRVFHISRPPVLAHNLYYRPWPPVCIYRPCPQFVFNGTGPQFLFTGPGQSGAWACIYQPCPPNLYLLALAYDFYYCALILHLPSYL